MAEAGTPSSVQALRGPTILVSAFEPFGGASVNASQEVARRLDGQTLSWGYDTPPQQVAIETLFVPVVAGEAERIVMERLRNGPRPLAYVALGEAGPERVVRLEKVYVNWDDFRIPDNAGNQPRDKPIILNAPAAYFTTMDFVQANWRMEGAIPVPTELSLSAGSFLCNHLAYFVSHFFACKPYRAVPFGFVHVPSWRPDDGEAELQKIVETIYEVIGCVPLDAESDFVPPDEILNLTC